MNPQTAARLLAVAKAEVGYTEFPAGTNHNKYAAEVAPFAQNQPWCAVFVSWATQHAGCPLPNIGQGPGLFTYCPYAVTYARANRQTVPAGQVQPGDILLFDWEGDGVSDHVGILEAVNPDGTWQTVEGNTSSTNIGSQSNGGGVFERRRSPGTVLVVWRPPVVEVVEEEDVAVQYVIKEYGDGRMVKVRPVDGGRKLAAVLASGWLVGDQPVNPAAVSSGYGTVTLDVARAIGKLGGLTGTVFHGQDHTNPSRITVSDNDGDYTFTVA